MICGFLESFLGFLWKDFVRALLESFENFGDFL